jgi:hypothetical protein
VGWGGVAVADILISPSPVAEGARALDCYLVSVGEVPRFVKIQVLI